jgi:thioester reductase-like protein
VILAEAASLRARPDLGEVVSRVRARLNLEAGRVVLLPPRALPKTSSGKLMRQRSRQLWEAGDFQVLGEEVRARETDEAAVEQAGDAPFAFFKAKYKLTGEETHGLTDAGLDSLDLVLLMHEFSELLAKRGARELADEVDIRLVQQMSIAELFRLAARFDEAPEAAVAQVRYALANVDEARRSEEDAMMRADRTLAFTPPAQGREALAHPPRNVLLTGATGFLGPFLITSLLEQTDAHVHALVRARDPEHARVRLRTALAETSRREPEFWRAFDKRVTAICGDLDEENLGLDPAQWAGLSEQVDTIYHNGAMVNYLFSYKRMRAANVTGTNAVLKLAFAGRKKTFNYVSTTFIYGWATKDVLYERDNNDDMELLDFGYSQSKWAAEQVVLDAARQGLTTRIFRPALITPSANGDGANFDITLRLLAFMIKYGVGVDALNQVSFMPADTTANNIVAISNLPKTAGGTFHVVRDDYANMIDVTNIITELTGRTFDNFSLPNFVPEVIRRCTREDFLFPLLDFLVGSIDNISAMEFKRYDSGEYQKARNASPHGHPDPSLEDTVTGMLRFMRRTGMIELGRDALAEQDAA